MRTRTHTHKHALTHTHTHTHTHTRTHTRARTHKHKHTHTHTHTIHTRTHTYTHTHTHRYRVHVTLSNGEKTVIESEALLNGTGRSPNVHDLGLEAAGIAFDARTGVLVDEFYQSTNPDVYACGDVASAFKFTHTADFSARLAIRNMFLGDRNTEAQLVIPWCTYTDPEVAHVGLYESELVAKGVPHET
jgi:pyruvate/2-oxoglutarate dehydrogenase complex dihydrolipoamide dehydrogenase (E3) component